MVGCAPREDTASLSESALIVVTFNTGTTEGLPHDDPPEDGYTAEDAARSDAWYGDGLAWSPAINAARQQLADVQPDLVAFQEIFWSDTCATIPENEHAGFVCAAWSAGDPTVAQVVLGAEYQIACHRGKPDKCLGVRRDWGEIIGCDADFCIDGLDGAPVEGCGSGARVAAGTIARADGSTLTAVSVHGTSGFSADDVACRVAQVDQAFARVDGPTIILGDLNVDPGRLNGVEDSATRWRDGAAAQGLIFHSPLDGDTPPTYQGIADIDHVLSNRWTGDCVGQIVMPSATYFDHQAIVCALDQ